MRVSCASARVRDESALDSQEAEGKVETIIAVSFVSTIPCLAVVIPIHCSSSLGKWQTSKAILFRCLFQSGFLFPYSLIFPIFFLFAPFLFLVSSVALPLFVFPRTSLPISVSFPVSFPRPIDLSSCAVLLSTWNSPIMSIFSSLWRLLFLTAPPFRLSQLSQLYLQHCIASCVSSRLIKAARLTALICGPMKLPLKRFSPRRDSFMVTPTHPPQVAPPQWLALTARISL